MDFPIKRFHTASTASTNDDGMQWVRRTEPGTIGFFSTDDQREGKGQRGRVWNSEPGADLTWSCALRWPKFSEKHLLNSLEFPASLPESAFCFNKSIALAVHRVLQNELAPSQSFRIKWPNDLFARTPKGWKKCGGILIESNWRQGSWDGAVAGIGLNLNSIHESASDRVSLRELIGHPVTIEHIKNQLEQAFENLAAFWFQPHSPTEYQTYVHRQAQAYNSNLLGLNQQKRYIYQGVPFDAALTGVDNLGRCTMQKGSEPSLAQSTDESSAQSRMNQTKIIEDHSQLKWEWIQSEIEDHA